MMEDPMLALVAALFGGVGLKVIESILSRTQSKNDLQTQMRSELRSDVVTLKQELDDIEESLDKWKKRYYRLFIAFNELALVAVSAGLEEEVEKIKRDIEGL